jgi:hypothetical protein
MLKKKKSNAQLLVLHVSTFRKSGQFLCPALGDKSYLHFLINKVTFLDSFRENDKRNIAEDATGIGYKQGLSIQTKVPKNSGGPSEKVGTLVLPQPVMNGQCQRLAPVQYLVNRDSSCNLRMTPDICSEQGGPFNTRSYITGSGIVQPSCPRWPAVLDQYDGTAFASIQANYFCTNDLNGYVKNLEDVQTDPSQSLFSTTVLDYTSCEFNMNGQFVCPNTTEASSTATTLTRCSYDNSLSIPDPPFYDKAKKICNNAVLGVEYKFYWAGKRIVNITANYVIGNVPLDVSYTKTVKEYYTVNDKAEVNQTTVTLTYPTTVTQRFSVRFIHDYNFTLVQSEDPETKDCRGKYSPRSGFPGEYCL